MESKILIDINYATRDPQIVIFQKDSDDPRDKLVSMLIGESMPGVRDGYCRIERYSGKDGIEISAITPIHPINLIKHIPLIAELAESNAACDTSEVPAELKRIIKGEYERLKISEVSTLVWTKIEDWALKNLSPDLYKKWMKDFYDMEYKKPS